MDEIWGESLFKKGLDVGLRAVTSEIGQKLIDKGIKHAPELYKIGTSKIKNNNLTKAPESDVANYIVEETCKKTKNRSKQSLWLKKKMANGITNFQIEEANILVMKT